MELKMNIGFEQIIKLVDQLSKDEKEKLISALESSIESSKEMQGERQLGKFKGQIWMSDDFNEPLDDFKEYM